MSCQPVQSPAIKREVRSRSLDIRLGEDYSQLLRFQYDTNIPALKQTSSQEEEVTNKAESCPSQAPGLPDSREGVGGEVQDNLIPSLPRSPPKSPTSPPSPVSPASPASPASPVQTESMPVTGKTDKHQEEHATEQNKDVEKEDVRTSNSHVMVMDVCPKSTSDSVYTR